MTLVWKDFQTFPASYRRIRIGWIDGARHRPAELQKRLRYLTETSSIRKVDGSDPSVVARKRSLRVCPAYDARL